jgi:hypothetical protein
MTSDWVLVWLVSLIDLEHIASHAIILNERLSLGVAGLSDEFARVHALLNFWAWKRLTTEQVLVMILFEWIAVLLNDFAIWLFKEFVSWMKGKIHLQYDKI